MNETKNAPTKEEIKQLIDNHLMSWERIELALSIVTPQEVLKDCSAMDLEKWTGMYVREEAPEQPEVTVRDFETWALIDELRRRKEVEDLLEDLSPNEIVGYMMSHFHLYDDDSELCKALIRFVLRDELKLYVK